MTPETQHNMKYRYCGYSGLELPAISLGFWHNFGYGDFYNVGESICRRAFDLGITHFDLANNYGPPAGAAEERFAQIFKHNFEAHRNQMVITTKAGYTMWDGPYGSGSSKKYLIASLENSLKTLGLDYIDIFYSHRYDENTPIEETMEALDQIRRQGKALYVGISSYDVEKTWQAVESIRTMGSRLLVHQPSYSMFDREIEDGLTDVLRQTGMGCVCYSPLAQGLLTDRYLAGIPDASRAARDIFLKRESITREIVAKVEALHKIALGRGQSLAQMALQWVLRDDVVTSALMGVSKVSHVESNVAALEAAPLSSEELQQIDAVLGRRS
ncbi:MAG: L-glyceraldehyde 3-phosphate reductase [Candidatus Competibacteraceae bacterium]|nr:L-glyceraldehyde 3-phosphate reductase [Candidatus Competibacteraceae bacterium]